MKAPITVASLRDRGEPQARDVECTRPGPWGNPFSVDQIVNRSTGEKLGWRALDLYRFFLRERVGVRARDLRVLVGARLLCACPADSLACHAWILAEEVDRLTGCGVELAPERRAA